LIVGSSLDKLQALVPPPIVRPIAPGWTLIESQLAIALPDDYKRLVEIYGPGSFDGFMWVLQPRYSNEYLDLVKQRDIRLGALRQVHEYGEVVQFPAPDGVDSLLPWAITENGDVCFWLLAPVDDPNSWVVVVNESRGDTWYRFEGSASQFLAAVLSGSSRVPLFPDDFPSAHPAFQAESD
jgi:hypothetical protein